MTQNIDVLEFRKAFNRTLKRTVDGTHGTHWPHMCFLQNRPPRYGYEDLPCIYPACTKKDKDHWGIQYCVSIRPPMFGSDIHKPNLFHLKCFGLVADLSYLPHLHRLWPLNHLTWQRADMSLKKNNIRQFLQPAAQRLLQDFKGTYYDWCAEQAGVPRKPEGPSHPDDVALKREESFSDRLPKNPQRPRDFELMDVMLE
ncbi:uncharacterized protein FIESC28_02906 [Fusarium coffeatum]|uniref:Uncharacterized protein n=1 Tax=Fusarium coffeatum TaxID=231269 RepID=A0A366S6V4_9HYPO|nr:uncharacterized protein FIESC28_02906 [Fusarium coffeatum]RBR24416.1 hypothetical protein FIESC28_02906 [Fusarium coffeatum]